ncbi:20042_t:CDS:1, partial [Gigaspora rosea]
MGDMEIPNEKTMWNADTFGSFSTKSIYKLNKASNYMDTICTRVAC